jgi:PAS domain S-box-containing protein
MFIRLLQSPFYWLWPILSWGLITSISLLWNLDLLESEVNDIARERGRIMYEMVRQTKINPLLMQSDPEVFKRQVMDDISYRAVSTRPMNPENRADEWESNALAGFGQAGDFVFERQEVQTAVAYRYIGPVFTQENCLSCHGYEGIKVGDLRGGISVTVNAAPIYAEQADTRQLILLTHFGGFLLLSASTLFLLKQLRNHWQRLVDTQEQLQQQEAFLSSITHTMGEGCVVVDREGVITFVNQEAEWILGWDTAQMLGKAWVDLVSPEIAAGTKQQEIALFETMKDGISRRVDEESFHHQDGFLIPVSCAVSALGKEGKFSGAVITFNDISERKRAEAERSSMERQLNQVHKMEAVGQLAGGIAHEINTPIQYIGENLRFLLEANEEVNSLLEAYRALLQVAESVAALQPQVEKVKSLADEVEIDYLQEETPKSLEQSLIGTEQVARIVLAMKEFAHPGSRQMAPADLNKVIQNAVAVSKNEWKYVADTELKLDQNLPEVRCVGGEISQVLLNLIVNAAHAIEKTQRAGKGIITITSGVWGEQLEVRVSDNGTGIPEAVRESVFNPFFTTKDVGQGTGQGLAIAQDIVVGKHKGELFFETEVGQGTTFVLRLPLTKGSSLKDKAV